MGEQQKRGASLEAVSDEPGLDTRVSWVLHVTAAPNCALSSATSARAASDADRRGLRRARGAGLRGSGCLNGEPRREGGERRIDDLEGRRGMDLRAASDETRAVRLDGEELASEIGGVRCEPDGDVTAVAREVG